MTVHSRWILLEFYNSHFWTKKRFNVGWPIPHMNSDMKINICVTNDLAY